MTEQFSDHLVAARAVLPVESLSDKEGQFCGGLTYRYAPLSDKQDNLLRILLNDHDLPALGDETQEGGR